MGNTVSSATYRLDLSPLDQTIPRLFVHKIFCFEFPDATLQAEAVERLEQSLSTALLKWPFLTGYVGPATTGTHRNDLELQYQIPEVGGLRPTLLIIRNLSEDEWHFPWTYKQLAEAGMPPSAFDMSKLSTVPEWPSSYETYPALSVQANFIPGGLLLCFALHHAVADGGSFTTFIKEMAAATRDPSISVPAISMRVRRRIGYVFAPGEDLRPLYSFPEYDDRNASRHPTLRPVTTRILTLSASTVRKLQAAVARHLKETVGDHAFASDISCVSGLIWIAVIRARKSRLQLGETAKMGIAVNARKEMDPPLQEDYFGNAVVHTFATAKVSELLDDNVDNDTIGLHTAIPIETIALGAWRMRQAVQSVNRDYVNDRIKTFSMLGDPTVVSKAYTRAMDTSHTGIDFSSWREQGANVEFNIPGTTTSTVDFWRKAWSPNEGAYNILPRKGHSKGDANWEVSLGLTVEDMEVVCSGDELGAWVSRLVE